MTEVDDIGKLIAAINPNYAENTEEVKSLLKEGFDTALAKAKPMPVEEHKIVYDSSAEGLEPLYFWILDFMKSVAGETEKLVDNFSSSPGSGYFSEFIQKAAQMQAQASKSLGDINNLIKVIVNIIYDLKEFEIRLKHYEAAKSDNKEEEEAGMLALKQIWMDNVDVKKGRGSINMLAQDLNFVTIRDAFMVASSVKNVDDIDLNDRVKRILKPRLQEFFEWKERSEKELIKRYQIERSYLKSEVDALKLYTRWARPYLKAAAELQQKEMGRAPELVKAFNTVILQLTLLGKRKVDFNQAIVDKKLPSGLKNMAFKRDYYSCVLVDFVFRGIPQRTGQHYVFGGRAEVAFRGYALNKDELKMLDQKLDEGDIAESLKLVSNMTDEALKQIQEDLEYYLKQEDQEKKVSEKQKSNDVNPFAALFGMAEKKEKKEEKKQESKVDKVGKDNYVEQLVRKIAEESSRSACFAIFDIYKKAHGMASHPEPDFDFRKQIAG